LKAAAPDVPLAIIFRGILPFLVAPYSDEVTAWRNEGIQGTTTHAALVRKYDFHGSYSSVQRFLAQIKADHTEVTTIL
jgi:hypothetical protein